jgi:alpha-galactosidase
MIKNIVIIFFLLANTTIFSQTPGIAGTPPMGWNSWNAFDLQINSGIVKAVADSMVSKGLAAAGYQYIVIDDGWQTGRDNEGRIIADSTKFPEGIKYLSDYVHAKGLKFGIYTCCGTKTCGGRPGSFSYEALDAQTYADWGVDFIKEDWCFSDGLDAKTQYKIMSDAIKATGRPMLLSLCEWGVSSPWEWAEGVGSMWRTTNDIQDCFDCVRNWGGMGWVAILEKNVNLAPYAGPGHWNDPDMLEVGNKSLTPVECRSHFSMWCMLAAPLIAGNNISTMNDTIKDILTAPEIIAVDQDPLGIQGTRVRNDAGLQVWQKPLKDGSVAIALLNVTTSKANMFVTLDEIGFKKGISSSVRDLWERKDLPAIKEIFTTEVEPHGVVVIKIKGEKSPVSQLKFDQTAVEINEGNHKIIQVNVFPSITPVTVTSSDENLLSLSLAGVNTYKLTANKTGNCELKAVTKDGSLTAVCKVNIANSNIPLPWKRDNILDNKASVTYVDGVFAIEGGGADIWGTDDNFVFVNMEASQDQSVSAKIISQTNPDPWAKSGLMFRESNASNSAFIMLCTTPGNGISLQWRDTTGTACSSKLFGESKLPVYLKLIKEGSKFTAYKSVDGKVWETLGDHSLSNPFKGRFLTGMGVSPHSSHGLNSTKFEDVKIKPLDEEFKK